MPFPHPNYAFNHLTIESHIHGIYDKYLSRVCTKFGIPWVNLRITRKVVLISLAQKNINIIDLFPTHGISLNNSERNCLYHDIYDTYSLEFLNHIKTEIFNSSSISCSRV